MNPKFKSFCPRYELINGHKIEGFFFILSTVIKDNMNQNKCGYCHMSGHNIRTCMMKTKDELDKQKHEHYIATHPLSAQLALRYNEEID